MNRTVRTLLGLLTIGLVALTSCKKDNQEPKKNEGTTYVSVAIGLKADGMRAGDDENNYSIPRVTLLSLQQRMTLTSRSSLTRLSSPPLERRRSTSYSMRLMQ